MKRSSAVLRLLARTCHYRRGAPGGRPLHGSPEGSCPDDPIRRCSPCKGHAIPCGLRLVLDHLGSSESINIAWLDHWRLRRFQVLVSDCQQAAPSIVRLPQVCALLRAGPSITACRAPGDRHPSMDDRDRLACPICLPDSFQDPPLETNRRSHTAVSPLLRSCRDRLSERSIPAVPAVQKRPQWPDDLDPLIRDSRFTAHRKQLVLAS